MARIRNILYLNPRDLEADGMNSRRDFGDLVGLAETIREHGVLQPLGVSALVDGYRVVYGNRRREAAIVVGLDAVPCVVLDEQNEEERLLCQLLENVQRKALNDMEQGLAFRRLRDGLARRAAPGTSERALNESVAKQLGLSPRTIQRYVALCELPLPVQELLRKEEITVTHAQHLHALGNDDRIVEVSTLAAEQGLSAADVGRLCAGLTRNPNIDAQEALERLRQGTEVPAVGADSAHVAERMARPPKVTEDDDEDLWDDEAVDPEEDAFPSEPRTEDGNRRFLIRSLDSFMDELGRLVRCVECGDLSRYVGADPKGKSKAIIAMRQLAYLSREVAP
jgi:ParB family transcriptional regulator, chromosome partitioning protein